MTNYVRLAVVCYKTSRTIARYQRWEGQRSHIVLFLAQLFSAIKELSKVQTVSAWQPGRKGSIR